MSSLWGEVIGATAIIASPLLLAWYSHHLTQREREREAARHAVTSQQARIVSWRARTMRAEHRLQRERITSRMLRRELDRCRSLDRS